MPTSTRRSARTSSAASAVPDPVGAAEDAAAVKEEELELDAPAGPGEDEAEVAEEEGEGDDANKKEEEEEDAMEAMMMAEAAAAAGELAAAGDAEEGEEAATAPAPVEAAAGAAEGEEDAAMAEAEAGGDGAAAAASASASRPPPPPPAGAGFKFARPAPPFEFGPSKVAAAAAAADAEPRPPNLPAGSSPGREGDGKPGYYAVRVGYAACPRCAASKGEGKGEKEEEGGGGGDEGEIEGEGDGEKKPPCGHVTALRGAIFLRWEDVKAFVEFETSRAASSGEGGAAGGKVSTAVAAAASLTEDPGGDDAGGDDAEAGAPASIRLPFHHNVEYKRFDDLERADRYLRRVIPAPKPPRRKRGKRAKEAARKAGRRTRIKHLSRPRILPDYPPVKTFNPPTKKWQAMYAAALAYREAHGNLDVQESAGGTTGDDAADVAKAERGKEAEELAKWIKYQRSSYRYYLEDPMGGKHSMTEEKVNRLKEAGFDWIVDDKKKWLEEYVPDEEDVDADGNKVKRGRGRPRKTLAMRRAELESAVYVHGRSRERNSRPIRPKWLEMLEKLKAYGEEHGTIEIPEERGGKEEGQEDEEELGKLRLWAKNQRNMHIRWRQGHDVGMTQEKADLLKEAGMDFPPAWEDMYVKVVQYKSQNGGSIEIPSDKDPILVAWMQRQNEVLGRHLQGKSTRLGDDRAMRLLALGFQGGRSGAAAGVAASALGGAVGVGVATRSAASRDFNARWDDMFAKLQEYKNEHGNCNVPTSSGTDLAHWVAAQRRMYNKLVSGKPGKRAVLDAVKMQRLTDLGFQFRPRGSYTAWDENIKGLWKFREEHGHCRVPVNHPTLGSFVKLARRDYKNWTQGKPSSMTPEREAALKDVGFVFEGGKTPQRAQTPIKTWNERLEELLQYKAEFGHTVVPQNSGQLGAWVHSQRVHYKKYKEGQKSQMTAEKALQLTEIGFCFNASDRYRGNRRHKTHEQEVAEQEEALAAEQQHQQAQQHYQQVQQVPQQAQQQQHYHHHHQLQETVQVPPLQPYI